MRTSKKTGESVKKSGRPGRMGIKKAAISVILMAALGLASSCAKAEGPEQQIVLTTGFEENEVFFVGTEKCFLPEINVYMRTSQSQYENVFGSEIWNRKIGNETLEKKLKDMALSRLARIKTMKLLAAEREIELSEEELEKCSKAADTYMENLSPADIALLSANRDLIFNMYSEYALADKVFEGVTTDVNPEISDDEARIITVKQILIKNSETDDNGNRIPYSEGMKKEALMRAQTILAKLQTGEDFDTLADRYNEGGSLELSFGRDAAYPPEFIEAAFSLDSGALSGVLETDQGYHILLCEDTFDREETDANKERILEKKKEEAFSRVYDDFVQTCYSDLNRELWDGVTYDLSILETKRGFFDVYNETFL